MQAMRLATNPRVLTTAAKSTRGPGPWKDLQHGSVNSRLHGNNGVLDPPRQLVETRPRAGVEADFDFVTTHGQLPG